MDSRHEERCRSFLGMVDQKGKHKIGRGIR